MKTRFAFDVGTNSIGWAVYRLENGLIVELIDTGVRIFSDSRNPKDGSSLAMMRRQPRSARRRRDRFIQRRTYVMDLLIRYGLMPAQEADRKALEAIDPYPLRAKGLDQALTPHELGRAIFHLNQRRGFKSNRIAGKKDGEDGKIKTAEKALKIALAAEFRTLGEFYAQRQSAPKVRDREAVRVRMNGKGAKGFYDFYPTRDLLEDEFDKLWAKQAGFHPEILADGRRDELRKAIFTQRPLKDPVIGKCTFEPSETRLPRAHPLSQARRIYQDLNHLKITDGLNSKYALTLAQRDKLAEVLLRGEDISFTRFRKLLDLPAGISLNFEEGEKEELLGDPVAKRLGGKNGALKRFWPNLTEDQRIEIVLKLLNEPDESALFAWLINHYGATPEEAAAASNTTLPDGHDRLGLTATRKILEQLRANVVDYATACGPDGAGYHHSDERDGEILDALPYYGQVLERHTVGGTSDPADDVEKRYGRVTNPTVHVGLNQLRHVVNALLKLYGHPNEIVIEFVRALKQSKEQKDKEQAQNKANEAKNKARKAQLEESGYDINSENLRRIRLWEELGPLRQCVYTGKTIGWETLFSPEIEIEHILPFSRTLDDSMANKTLAFREANRNKRNESPDEAFSGTEYAEILQRAQVLPANKRWRFDTNSMKRFEEQDNWLNRQLNDTRHLSRLAKAYLVKICDDPKQAGIYVTTGQMTALLRQRYGLNGFFQGGNRGDNKDRNDHRHHAVDAMTIGTVDRPLLNRIHAQATEQEQHAELEKVIRAVPREPFFGFYDQARARFDAILVSHKAEHGKGGALHEETNYGLVKNDDAVEGELVTRKAIESLSPKEIDRVRDRALRAALQDVRAAVGTDAKALSEALKTYGGQQKPPIRRVRILKKQEEFIPIKDRRTGEPYRAVIPGENHHMDIVEGPDGIWRGFAATVFEVNQKTYRPRWQTELPGAKLIMRLHKNDLVEVDDDDGVRRVKRVVRLNPASSRLFLADHTDSGDLQKRHDDPDDLFRWDLASISKLKARRCLLIKVGPLGKR